MYKLKHTPTKAFTGFAKKNRTFFRFGLSDKNSFEIVKDSFARPQPGIFIEGKTKLNLIAIFNENKSKISGDINNTEIVVKWRRLNKSLGDVTPLKDALLLVSP